MSADRLVLWRHGRTASNHEGRFQGQLDVPLDEVGRAQAEAAALVLAKLGPAALVSSDLSRAADTAAALASMTGLDVATDARLREVDAGAWQGLTGEQIRQQWPQEYREWRAGGDLPLGGGERRSEVAARAAGAVREHAAAASGLLVVVGHGAALKGTLITLLGLHLDSWRAFTGFANCHWATLLPRGEGWALDEFNVGPRGATEGPED